MITFLANNWYWLLFIGAMVFMHACQRRVGIDPVATGWD